MSAQRFYVGNLPSNITEADIYEIFHNHGQIAKVEIKTKDNLGDPSNEIKFAFVTLQLDEGKCDRVINAIVGRKINGSRIQVSLAKESFLERLNREREEAKATAETPARRPLDDGALTKNLVNKRKKFDDEVTLDDYDIPAELMITKKKAAASIRNGKIFIQGSDAAPIHVITTKKPHKATEKSVAEKRRKESLVKMNRQYMQKKDTVQQALANLDGGTSKKIIFRDDHNVGEAAATKVDIFKSNDDSADEDADKSLKLEAKEFTKADEKLYRLKSKQSSDPRFKLNSKFVDEDECLQRDVKPKVEDDEKTWQMSILEQIIGRKMASAGLEETKSKKMMRFDPTKLGHEKLLRTRVVEEKVHEKVPEKKIDQTRGDKGGKASEGGHFYVSDNLTQSLNNRDDGFSLLTFFGEEAVRRDEQRRKQIKNIAQEEVVASKKTEHTGFQPFSDDSFSDDDNEVVGANHHQCNLAPQSRVEANTKAKKKMCTEPFFIVKNGPRQKEGAKFFESERDAGETAEHYEEARKRLQMMLRTKIAKTMKNITSHSRERSKKAG